VAVNPRLIDVIAGFEGFSAKAYVCPGGKWTIGFGTTKWPDGRAVKEGDVISRETARDLLTKHAAWVQGEIARDIPAGLPPHVTDACVSLAYNIGIAAFKGSTCLKRLKDGDLAGAAEALRWWNKADGVVLGGLIARREAEADIMLKGWDGTANSDPKAQVIVEAPPTVAGSRTMQGVFQILSGLAIALVTAAPEIVGLYETGRATLSGKQGVAFAIAFLPIASGAAQIWYARYQDWRNGKR
jgi:lysozyme